MIGKEFLFNFISGGLLIASCGYISKYFSSYLSGLVYGSLPLGAFYLYLYSDYLKNNKMNFIHGSVIGGIIWVVMVSLLYFNTKNPYLMVFIASIIYLVTMYLALKLIK